MPFNLLLVPLLGGYVFLHRTHYCRYHAVRLSNYRLLFNSALTGLFLTIAAYGTTRLILDLGWSQEAIAAWKRLAPFPYSGAAFGAFFLGCVAPEFINRTWWTKERSAKKVIGKHGDALQQLLFDAQRNESAVMLSLKSGKLYIGKVTLSDGLVPSHVRILPTLSGYRDPTTHEVKYTSTYHRIYPAIKAHLPEFEGMKSSDFQVVLPYSEILLATPFILPVDQQHFALHAPSAGRLPAQHDTRNH